MNFIAQSPLQPGEMFFYLGLAYYKQKNYQESSRLYQIFLTYQDLNRVPSSAFVKQALSDLAECYRQLHQLDQLIQVSQHALGLTTTREEVYKIYFSLVDTLCKWGRWPEAKQFAATASHQFPNSVYFLRSQHLMLPILYDTVAEIDLSRQEFTKGLSALIKNTSLATVDQREQALKLIGTETNFCLAYQAQNDLNLQITYGEFAHKIIAANYPELCKPLPVPPLTPQGKIRVGYISHYLCQHTVSGLYLGWLRSGHSEQFEIYSYSTNPKFDLVTAEYKQYSDQFEHWPHPPKFDKHYLQSLGEKIRADQLHILVFLDIGMHPTMTILAGMRLAPIQCVTWGHPVTSGLPTIDYFLSSQLMEPPNAQSHYSEQLICLPKLSISFAKPLLKNPKNRANFQLDETRVIYLCCQSLFKYLPQYDYLFPAIAQRVPQAQFVFIQKHHTAEIFPRFWGRLEKILSQYDLPFLDHCRKFAQLPPKII